jgi:hypothetical protein
MPKNQADVGVDRALDTNGLKSFRLKVTTTLIRKRTPDVTQAALRTALTAIPTSRIGSRA